MLLTHPYSNVDILIPVLNHNASRVDIIWGDNQVSEDLVRDVIC